MMDNQIADLEREISRLQRVNTLLTNSFDERLEEEKQAAYRHFFSRLNSDRYGHILDLLSESSRELRALRRSGEPVPRAFDSVYPLVMQLMAFVRDSDIAPIMPLGQPREVRVEELNSCEYIGRPFASETETRRVETVSPGWRMGDIRISDPVVREVDD